MIRLAALVLVTLAAAAHASPTLERGIKLYDKRDYFSASIELMRVVSGETGDDAPTVQRAQFFLAKTLHQAGFRGVSLSYFERVAQNPAHRYHALALKWILTVPGPAIPHVLTVFSPDEVSQLDAEGQDAFRFHTGQYAEVTATSPLWSRAQLGLAKLAFARGDVERGLDLATAAARDAALAGDAARLIAERAPARAVKALPRIRDDVAVYLASRLAVEASGRLVAISDPIVLATACVDGPADNIVSRVDATTAETRALLGKLLADDDNVEVFEQVQRVRGERRAAVAIRLALATPEHAELIAWHRQLVDELARVQRADRAWQTTQIAAEVMQELTVQSAVLSADIGKYEAERLHAFERAIAQAFTGTRTAVPVGPHARAGLVVSESLCRMLLANDRAPAIASGRAPVGPPPPRAHGCAGCAAGGAPACLIVAAAFPWRRRARRPGPTARGASAAARR